MYNYGMSCIKSSTACVLICILVVGCGGTGAHEVITRYGGRPADVSVYGAVASWASHPVLAYLPPRCSEQLDRLRVVRAHPKVFVERCAVADCFAEAGCSAKWSCLSVINMGSERIPIVWVHAGLPPDTACLEEVHQSIHWLGWCTGSGLDMLHGDPSRWSDVYLLGGGMCK